MEKNSLLTEQAFHLLKEVKERELSVEEQIKLSLDLTALLINEAKQTQTKEEKTIEKRLARLMDDPNGKTFTTRITDQCFRSNNPKRVADQIKFTLKRYGIPKFATPFQKLQLKTFGILPTTITQFITPLIKRLLRKETNKVIIPGERKPLLKHIEKRYKEGVRINLNHLGEAILGEEEAKKRLEIYIHALTRPEIEYISVKISTIYSQINLLAWEETVNTIADRLKILYRTAMKESYHTKEGEKREKFVNLDMEEHRDLHLTVEVFKKVLSEPEFFSCYAGIVIQSYLPESYAILEELTKWATERIEKGGAPIKVRLVKGANLAMEKVEASIEGWPQTPYTSKIEVDANYKKMVAFALQKEHVKGVHIGIASHNLFDIANALILRSINGVEKEVCFEMLEGMADHQRRAVQKIANNMLLYCPSATKEDFVNAVAYLVRRLDENTSPENFLRHVFALSPGSKEWENQANMFKKSFKEILCIQNSPRRKQDRKKEVTTPLTSFENAPNTDWSIQANREWIQKELSQLREKEKIPLVINGKEIWKEEQTESGFDPSNPQKILYTYTLATEKEAEQAIQCAKEIQESWERKGAKERSKLLASAAEKLREERGSLIAIMVADSGKIVSEADAEISEAIDFCEYYRRNSEELDYLEDIEWNAKGVVLVTPPWNFPCAIPLGGVVAALATGNSVLFKPARETLLVAWKLVNLLWEAGIPKKVLQLMICEDQTIGSMLIKDPRIDSVILTGATETAELFLKMRPGIDLHAETGGKNALIVTSLSDRDLAIKMIIQSAFGHAGQKCSACSLLILEAEVYDSLQFKKQLKDTAESLIVGSAYDFKTKVNPLIHEPNEKLLKGLTTLEEGEEWLLKPKQDPQNPRLWSPGIKWGVKENSFLHQTELFGPLLGVMRAENLQEAISFANGTPYGLTSGLHSLDIREQNYWMKQIRAGNLYINRGITGAIVQRQPFGGCKKSSFGQGNKAGGPNYLIQLMHAAQKNSPKEKEPVLDHVLSLCKYMEKAGLNPDEKHLWNSSVCNYAFYWNHYFSKTHDPSKLLGQDNLLKYVPRENLLFRIQKEDSWLDVLRVVAASLTCHCELKISGDSNSLSILKNSAKIHRLPKVTLFEETEKDFIQRIEKKSNQRIRLLTPPSVDLLKFAANQGTYLDVSPVLANGRLELLHYLREVSISNDYHRYGNLGRRENEQRTPLKEEKNGTDKATCSIRY